MDTGLHRRTRGPGSGVPGSPPPEVRRPSPADAGPPTPAGAEGRRDLLRLPVLGPALRWRHSRTAAQTALLILAAVLVLDGFFGPQLAHRNWAGVLPWIHWRGLVILALLVAGNLFCFACPFMLPRRLAKRFFPANRPWPARLRSKWLAVVLLVGFFWGYEAFDLWASPWLTAWVVVAYFALAFVVDGVFRGAAFCKHVCPIGQFNFVHSTLSPLEVAVRDADVCSSCRTKDCIRGRHVQPTPVGNTAMASASPALSLSVAGGARLDQNGCELWLFQPRKVGNLDCTFCLDCVQACPHDNVGILTREPGRELWEDPLRSGVGRLSQRPDMAALALVLVAAAFVNAFGMTTPVYGVMATVGGWFGTSSDQVATTLLFLGGLVAVPAVVVALAAWGTRTLGGEEGRMVDIVTRYSWSLVPVGFGMWVAHYLHHFLSGALTVIPVGQQYLRDLGFAGGPPRWALGPIVPLEWILPLQLLFLETGLLVSLVVAWRIASRLHPAGKGALRSALPWMIVAGILSAAGIWLLFQPMDMRGTLLG